MKGGSLAMTKILKIRLLVCGISYLAGLGFTLNPTPETRKQRIQELSQSTGGGSMNITRSNEGFVTKIKFQRGEGPPLIGSDPEVMAKGFLYEWTVLFINPSQH